MFCDRLDVYIEGCNCLWFAITPLPNCSASSESGLSTDNLPMTCHKINLYRTWNIYKIKDIVLIYLVLLSLKNWLNFLKSWYLTVFLWHWAFFFPKLLEDNWHIFFSLFRRAWHPAVGVYTSVILLRILKLLPQWEPLPDDDEYSFLFSPFLHTRS